MNTSYKVIGLTRLGIEPQVYRSRSRRYKPLGHLIGGMERLNKTKRGVIKLYFFQYVNSLTLNTVDLLRAQRIVYRDNLSAITKCITKAISVINKSKLF